MEFNSHVFLVLFLPIALLGIRFLPLKPLTSLVLFSLVFYFWENTVAGCLLIISATVVWAVKRYFDNKLPVKVVVTILLILPFLFYRYSSHLIEVLPFGNFFQAYPSSLLLPAGISFYTFQLIGLVHDDIRRLKPVAWGETLLFSAFFPQLIAGPIEKLANLLPQYRSILSVRRTEIFRSENVTHGLVLVSFGVTLKTFGADVLITYLPQLNQVQDATLAILLIFGNSAVIYYDFWGYSVIAIGLGRIFGIKLSRNFNRPYASINFRDFWRRWHITLGRWFTTYIYIPLGGNRNRLIAASVAFLLTGLWHGATFRFVVWGLCHGLLVVLSPEPDSYKSKFSRFFFTGLTFIVVSMLWLLFFYDFSDALHILLSLLVLPASDGSSYLAIGMTMSGVIERFVLVACLLVFAISFDDSKLLSGEIFDTHNKPTAKGVPLLTSLWSKAHTLFLQFVTNPFICAFLFSVSILFFSYRQTFIYFRF